MPRYALKIEYHGAPFSGWQRQNDRPSVQGAIEEALAKLEPGPHNIAAAGRTDAGVHALAQVAHCDLERDWAPFRLSEALNFHLHRVPVAIVDCARVAPEWHARFSAIERRYTYRILMRRARSFLHNQVRSFVGTLERVGAGSWSPDHVKEALAARTRSACGTVAVAMGLYLAQVTYAEDPFDGDDTALASRPMSPHPSD